MTQQSQHNWAGFLFSFKGRIGRKPFWIFNLIVFMGAILLGFFTEPAQDLSNEQLAFMLWVLWPSLAVQAKRWHDIDRPAWWILINLIPIAGPLWALFENGFVPGTRRENRYGPDPSGD
jgi:uncharacterized membrane protein YhaH (DUF805 family)